MTWISFEKSEEIYNPGPCQLYCRGVEYLKGILGKHWKEWEQEVLEGSIEDVIEKLYALLQESECCEELIKM